MPRTKFAGLFSPGRTRKPYTRRRPATRLNLELLEDRTTPASLQLTLPNAITEGATGIATVTRVETDVSQALTVNLVSSDTTQATVPAYVVIQAGQDSANFIITGYRNP